MSQRAPTWEDYRRCGHAMVDFIADYLSKGVSSYPVMSQVQPHQVYDALPTAAPNEPETFDAVMEDVRRVILPGCTHWQHPGFFAFFPANSSPPSLLGDMLCSGLGVQGMLWITSPACTELEMLVLDWMAKAAGLPEHFLSTSAHGGGVLQGTASEAVVVCLVAARQRCIEQQPAAGADALRRMVVYVSSQTHSSVRKGFNIAGFADANFRIVPCRGNDETDLSMDARALDAMIRADRDAGLLPCLVAATIGTTSTVVADDLAAVGRVCNEHGVWLHVDGAYAGSATVCEEHRGMLSGIELADSYCFNPHKWLLVNFDCSCLWVKDRRPMVNALSIVPEYLRNAASDSARVIDYRDWQVPLGRRFRALKLWFVMRMYGVSGLKEHVRKHVRMASEFAQWVRDSERFELCNAATLGLVVFRLKHADNAVADALNKKLLERVNADGRIYLTHTALPSGRYVLRFSVGTTNTEAEHVAAAWRIVNELADAVVRENA